MSAPSHNVQVANLNEATTQETLRDFFTFCGKISSIDFSAGGKSAVIHFEKPSAAKTAVMLNGGTLDGSQIQVSSDSADIEHVDEHDHVGGIEQSDKPRAGIAAEYLAKGYTLSNDILQRAIEIDNKQGISKRFLSYIQSFDHTVGEKVLGPEKTISGKVQETAVNAQQQAKAVDEQNGITKTAGDYYSRAISSPLGQKVLSFYTTTSKQVLDIHEEAKRLAEQQKTTEPTTGASAVPDAASAPGPVASAPATVV
ncbi:hypothetical protein BDV98DRAFT_603504 [Pterulicium gracile]|uniref:RRM domain-containing protein n=1 Tax=Pterulicium gracile TaxID=1884261 RepID=A0A5C3QSF5_9AGAR|nr:hypothetical protein BDV98DRAFT_603504 [Pterula gracilis]